MQTFANVGQAFTRVVSKATGKGYWQGRVGESHKGTSTCTWFTVRIMVDEDPGFKLGDFVRVTGQLKVDFYMNKEDPPKPSGNLLIIAFEAKRIEKPSEVIAAAAAKEKAKELQSIAPTVERTAPVQAQVQAPPAAKPAEARPAQTPAIAKDVQEQYEEPDWSTLYA